jgi:hypothetical protein
VTLLIEFKKEKGPAELQKRNSVLAKRVDPMSVGNGKKAR